MSVTPIFNLRNNCTREWWHIPKKILRNLFGSYIHCSKSYNFCHNYLMWQIVIDYLSLLHKPTTFSFTIHNLCMWVVMIFYVFVKFLLQEIGCWVAGCVLPGRTTNSLIELLWFYSPIYGLAGTLNSQSVPFHLSLLLQLMY